jgi:hypothetical protein
MIRRTTAGLLALTTVAMLLLGLAAPPAGALTGNEKFIMAVHEDFLLRTPDSGELAWWSGYLSGGGSRASLVVNVLDTDEFSRLWVLGASQYYLGGTDSQFGTVLTNLNTTGDFVASEVALIAGAAYFSENGGTNTSFVQAVYDDVLLRPADTPGLTYWVGRLNTGTSTRSSVANHFIRTTESANRRVGGTAGMTACSSTVLSDTAAVTAGTYCIVLDRLAGATEISYWSGQLSGTDQLPSLWASVAGSTEYYNNAQSRF